MNMSLNPDQIETEVGKYLMMLESMESDKIISSNERSKLKTKVKAWAYDRGKEWEEWAPKVSE